MNMEMVKDSYPAREAIDLMKSVVEARIKFQEERIEPCMNEEDIEMRERSIRYLQRDLSVMHCALQGIEGRV